jgi:drug/metabolite transporter (DMT)-like permease
MNANSQLKIVIYLMIPPILWAGNAVIGKFASDFIGPFSLSFYRWLLASGLLLIIAAKPLYLSRSVLLKNWKSLAILGILGTGIFNTLLYLGLNSTSASNAGIVLATLPIMIILLNYFMGFERTSTIQIIGMIISLTGVVWVITQGELIRLLQFKLNPGDLIILVAVFTWALYSVLLKKLRPADLPTLPFLAIQFLVGLVFIFPFFAYEQSQSVSIIWNKQTLLILAYVAIFPSLIAFFFWQQGVAMGGANIAGFISPLITVFTAALAYFFLHESLSNAQITGAILVISGVILALSNSFRAKAG